MKEPTARKKVLVIGAGPSGLAALKEMLARGHDAVAVEKAASYGGVFRKGNAKTYDDLFLTTSNYFMAFSDFAPSDGKIRYSTKKEYAAYLDDYVAHFELLPHIRFSCAVERAFQDESGQWVVVIQAAEAEAETLVVDHLIVASGSHHVPNMVAFEGFAGETLHSSQYTSREPFKDKRVLVVGIGESASDIAAEICEVASETVVWSRRPFMIAPRYPFKTVVEKDYDEHTILRSRQDEYANVDDFLEFGTISRLANAMSVLSYSLMRVLVFRVFREASFVSGSASAIGKWISYATTKHYWQQDQATIITKNGRLASMVAQDKLNVIIAPAIQIDGSTVTFEEAVLNETGQEQFDFDVIVSCTGYKTAFSWLEADIEYNPRSWYRHCFPPNYGGTLAFLGWARPHQGGIPACAEMLARYTALLISGERTLPADIEERIKVEAEKERRFFANSPHVETLVDYPSFMEAMAKEIGCVPQMPNPFLRPRLFFKYWVYPNWACWYRRDGVGRNPAAFEAFYKDLDFNFAAAMGMLLPELLLIFLSLPVYGVYGLLMWLGVHRPKKLAAGWMWIKPRKNHLHGNM